MIHSTVACFDVTKKSDYVTFSDEMGQKEASLYFLRSNIRNLFDFVKIKNVSLRM